MPPHSNSQTLAMKKLERPATSLHVNPELLNLVLCFRGTFSFPNVAHAMKVQLPADSATTVCVCASQ